MSLEVMFHSSHTMSKQSSEYTFGEVSNSLRDNLNDEAFVTIMGSSQKHTQLFASGLLSLMRTNEFIVMSTKARHSIEANMSSIDEEATVETMENPS